MVGMLGLVVGFASFWGSRLSLAWQTQKYQHFQATSRGGLASGPPE